MSKHKNKRVGIRKTFKRSNYETPKCQTLHVSRAAAAVDDCYTLEREQRTGSAYGRWTLNIYVCLRSSIGMRHQRPTEDPLHRGRGTKVRDTWVRNWDTTNHTSQSNLGRLLVIRYILRSSFIPSHLQPLHASPSCYINFESSLPSNNTFPVWRWHKSLFRWWNTLKRTFRLHNQ